MKVTPSAGGASIKVTVKYEGVKLTSAPCELSSVELLEPTLVTNEYPAEIKVGQSGCLPLSQSRRPLSKKNASSVRPALPPNPQLQVEILNSTHSLNRKATHRRCGYFTFEIADRGCGIPEHVRTQIFGEFFQFDPDRLQGGGGSGMGLWISREIIRRHGGDITFRPGDDGVGTVISIRLAAWKKLEPERNSIVISCYSSDRTRSRRVLITKSASWNNNLRDADVAELILKHPSADIDGSKHNLHNVYTARFLVVDDSDLNRRIIIKNLERAAASSQSRLNQLDIDMEISEADDGENAVELVLSAERYGIPFDVVFMDNIMLRMNGPEAAQLMRKNGFKGRIIGVTGNVLPEDMQAFVDSGADRVLPKPVGVEQIKNVLDW